MRIVMEVMVWTVIVCTTAYLIAELYRFIKGKIFPEKELESGKSNVEQIDYSDFGKRPGA